MAPVDLTQTLSEPAVRAAADGRLLLARCRACGEAHYYPRVPCPFCWSEDVVEEDASGAGRIYSFAVTHQRDALYVIAYVTLAEGPTIMTNIVETPFEEIAIDQEVELVIRATPHGIHAPFFRGRRT